MKNYQFFTCISCKKILLLENITTFHHVILNSIFQTSSACSTEMVHEIREHFTKHSIGQDHHEEFLLERDPKQLLILEWRKGLCGCTRACALVFVLKTLSPREF